MCVALARVASAQRADGAIGVSLTIVATAEAPGVVVTGVRLDPHGVATILTVATATAHTSQLVMTRASSSTSSRVAPRYVPAMACVASEQRCAAREVPYRVDVGRPDMEGAPRDVQLRIEYLVVAGT